MGVAVGWLGYPNPEVVDGELCCFFSGHISGIRGSRYFIDGVAIHGVSGGPVFLPTSDGIPMVIGCISQYRPNISHGAALPGLLIADNASDISEWIARESEQGRSTGDTSTES